MNKAGAQSLPRRASTPSLPSPLSISTKDEAKKWLEQVVADPRFPKDLNEKAVNLERKINTKGQPWDELKPELETLHKELAQFRESQRQQVLQVGFPAPVLHDPMFDALVQKYHELEIAKQLKVEVTADMEDAKIRLKADIGDNFDKIKKLKSDLAERDETITDLRNKVKELTKEKEALEKKIKMLENEIDCLKRDVSELQLSAVEKDKKIEKLMQMHADRIKMVTEESQDMTNRIKELESRNEELEQMSAVRIVVGETMKIAIKEIYKHVHPKLPHRKKRAYAVAEISDHISQKYSDDPEEKKAAQSRWDKLKAEFTWNEDKADIIQDLIDKRNDRAHQNPPVDETQFMNALRQMKEKNDIEDEEEVVAYGIFIQCRTKFNI